MRLFTAGLAALALTGCVLPMPGMMGGMGGATMTTPEQARQQSAALQASKAAAEAQASHPGDANMDCQAIQAELMATMQDPKYQAALASMGSTAKSEKAKIDAAQASGKVTKSAADAGATGVSMAGNLEVMMPTIMRSQKLNEMASAKKCAFLKGQTIPTTH